MTLKRSHAFWILNAFGWLLLAWINILLEFRSTLTSRRLLAFHAIVFGVGFLICVPMRYVYRASLRKSRSPVRIALTIGAVSLLAANIWEVCIMLAASAVIWERPTYSPEMIREWYRGDWLAYWNALWEQLWPFLSWSTIYHAGCILLDNRSERLRAARAEQMARQAQLEALRYQVNPHFLFNALNTVRSMIVEDPEAAREMTGEIAAFFRQTLTRTDRIHIPLREEMRVVQNYLAIEKRRFGDRIRVALDLAPEAEDALIPCFTIQPLVENAIKHGMRTSSSPLSIRVSCRLEGNVLQIEVVNSGSWRDDAPDGETSTGSGLGILRERLACTYGDRCQLSAREENGSVWATIRIADPTFEEA